MPAGASLAPLGLWAGSLAGLGLSRLAGGSSPPSQGWVTTLLTLALVSATAATTMAGIVRQWRARRPAPLRCTDPVHHRLDRQLNDVLTGAYLAYDGSPAEYRRVRLAVDESSTGVAPAVEAAVWWTVAARRGRRWIDRYPVNCFGGQHSGGLAAATWLTGAGAPVPPDAAAEIGDFIMASRVDWWWSHSRFVVVTERPSALHVEQVGALGRPPADVRRLHRTAGPAAQWADGYRVYAFHGIGVPADLVEDGWSVEANHRHPHSEVRRAAIELIGWADHIDRAGWRLLATAPDPGNHPHELHLYADPHSRLPGVRVLVMTNGSPDRFGTPRRYAEWQEFQQHFELRKVELGTCGRPYGTPCAHEHACVRCPMLRVDPAQRRRLDEITRNFATASKKPA